MRNLLFENNYGERRVIATCETSEDVSHAINAFIDKCNENKPTNKQFKSYYTRCWETDEGTYYDVGSHCEFFILKREE